MNNKNVIGMSIGVGLMFLSLLLLSFGLGNSFKKKSLKIDEVTVETVSMEKHGDLLESKLQPSTASSSKKVVKKVEINPLNTVLLFSDVNYYSVNSALKHLKDLNEFNNDDPIYLVIDSPGGGVLDGARLISAMEVSRRPVYTVFYGICASMGAMIHGYGKKRMSFDRSILMYHNAAGGAAGELTKMLSQLQMVERFTGRMEEYITKRAGMDIKDYHILADRELWIDAEDALHLKLTDNLVYLNGLEDILEASPSIELKGRQRLHVNF